MPMNQKTQTILGKSALTGETVTFRNVPELSGEKACVQRVDGRSCADAGHDYNGAVYVSRAKWVCPICQEDISFTYTLWWEAVHGADSPIVGGERESERKPSAATDSKR